ncbi:hypothetical protein LOC67_09980 [Stieleria sp. JC731]|uniref:hypothetical protein n=1 Tax=Pirellulaceae TaxID=2691357 RepID=UPI001E5352D6|nr:hypothetical protein [Stieleria sp. JC731]MCC9600895.1 hypothetical protein [Stieleria sp. JC731]
MTSSYESLDRCITQVIEEANQLSDGTPSSGLRSALNALTDHQQRQQAGQRLASRLDEVFSAPGAGFLAVYFGAAVESGADPDVTGPSIVNAMLRFASSVDVPGDDACDDDDEDFDPATVTGLELLGQGLVAHVSRSPNMLQRLSHDPTTIAELERVEHISPGPGWVLELLRKRSGELLVIHVQHRRGFQVAYENLSNCFHLFTLLQAALQNYRFPETQTVPRSLLNVAKGMTFEDQSDTAWWHYGVGTYPEADFGGTIWGEANPESIPEVDGRQVVLLWPPVLQSRSWGTGFFGPFLQAAPPNVKVLEELDSDEVQRWCDRLNLPWVKPKPRWKFW